MWIIHQSWTECNLQWTQMCPMPQQQGCQDTHCLSMWVLHLLFIFTLLTYSRPFYFSSVTVLLPNIYGWVCARLQYAGEDELQCANKAFLVLSCFSAPNCEIRASMEAKRENVPQAPWTPICSTSSWQCNVCHMPDIPISWMGQQEASCHEDPAQPWQLLNRGYVHLVCAL